MKIFRPKKKPGRWEIVYCVALIVVGLVCRLIPLPQDKGLLQSAIAFGGALMPVGIGFMIGMALRWSRYHNLSPEERRDEDRQDKDERNLMIRDRAAWITYNVVVCALAVIGAIFAIMDNWGAAILCIGMSVFGLIVWSIAVVWIRRKPL